MHHSNRMYLGQKYILFTPADLVETPLPIEYRKGFLWEEQNSLEHQNFKLHTDELTNYIFILKLLR